MSIAVWCSSKDVPGFVCGDARLTDKTKTRLPFQNRKVSTTDQIYGQAGWDIGINFVTLEKLAGLLETLLVPKYVADGGRYISRGEIRRLAIHTHGVSGTLFVNGQDSTTTLSAETIPQLQTQLCRIGLMTPDDARNPAVIVFPGCLAASGKDGTKLLVRLSELWPNRKVAGFISLGYAPGGLMSRTGESCNEAGMRDTTALSPGEADANAGKYWPDLTTWPWASENSPRAKVAFNGHIIAGKTWD